MNEEAGAATIEAPPTVAAPKPKRTWRKALDLVWHNKKATMLPLVVTQVPLAVIGGAVYFYLYYQAYPDADFESFRRFESAPSGLIFTIIIVSTVYLLFSMVGGAASVVGARNIIQRKPVKLAESLDPAFTRMGGLLVLGAVFYGLLLGTAAGIILLPYFIVRWGLAVHAHILEGTGIGGSLGASWRMLRGRMLRFTGLLLTGLPVSLACFTVATIVFSIALAPFGADPGRSTTLAAQSAGFLVAAAVAIPTLAYLAAATTLFYLSAQEETRA